MTSAVSFVSCYIEGSSYPRATCHRHHLTPRHAGGTDDPTNLVWLSANAHQMVHRAAQMIKAGRKGDAVDLSMAAYASPSQRKRFLDVVQSEVQASLEVKRGTREGSKDVVVEVPVPRDIYLRLKVLVHDFNAGSSSRISVSSYVARLVAQYVRKSSL